MRKILISSDPHGRFDLLLPKIIELNNKNKFDFMVITGNTCPSTATPIFRSITNKQLQFPLPTYFIDSSDMSYVLSTAYPDGCQLLPNFFYLGNLGYKNIMGIKIAYFSGNLQSQDALVAGKNKAYKFTKLQAKKLIDQLQGKQVNILLTNQWAEQYKSLDSSSPCKNQTISQICYEMSPRYHIAAGGTNYLRLPPFKGRKGNPTHFINIAQIRENLPKDKYLVAIQLNPEVSEIIQNIAQNPLVKNASWDVVQPQQSKFNIQSALLKAKQAKKLENRQKVLDKSSFIMFEGFPEQTPNSQITQFMEKWGEITEIQVFKKLKGNKKSGVVRFKNLSDAQICLKDSGKYTMYQSRIKFQIKQQNEKYNIKDCFLCQGNQRFDSNLVVYKGNFCYICLDKGPVTQNHFQIVPINHVSTTSQLQRQQQQQISKFRQISQNYLNSKGITLVCIERYMNLSIEINHVILHCIPIKMEESEVLSKFKQINYENKYRFEDLDQKRNQNRQSSSPYYILIQINNKRLIKNVDKKDKKFEQGRQIMCEIIDKPERLNWRDCEMKADQISKSLQYVKNIFK